MQQITYLVIGILGLLVGYLFFRINKLSANKVVERKLESQAPVQTQARPEKITNPTIHTEKLKAGGRDYFFDIRGTQRGDRYIHITESRLKDGQEFRGNIVIFEDHIEEFTKILEDVKNKISKK